MKSYSNSTLLFQPIPCKPLYFDVAREHIEFPDLSSKLNQGGGGESEGGQKQGWLGGWLGWGAKK